MPETLEVIGSIRRDERAHFLQPLIRASFAEADSMRESLTLIRPRDFKLEALDKSQDELQSETQKHERLASQLSLFDSTAKPLVPCSMRFIAHWKDQDGNNRRHECDDWETSAAFNRFSHDYGRQRAIEILKEIYEDKYMKSGLALGFSTHKRRNAEFGGKNQWLLVGMIRLDEVAQASLPL